MIVRPATCTQELSIMKNLVSRFVKDESGATAIEYALIAAGIAIAIISAVNGVGTALQTKFNAISSSWKLCDQPRLQLQGPQQPLGPSAACRRTSFSLAT